MWWRLSNSEFVRNRGEINKMAFKNIVDSGGILGVLVYFKSHPVGWCAVAPRETFPKLERSRILKRVDDMCALLSAFSLQNLSGAKAQVQSC